MKTLKRIIFRDNSIILSIVFKFEVAEDLNLFHIDDILNIDDKVEVFLNIIQIAYDSTCKKNRRRRNKLLY